MNSPPYLWVIILWAGLSIPGVLLIGIAAALRQAGHSGSFVRRAIWSAGIALYGWLALAWGLCATGFFAARSNQYFPTIILPLALPVIAGYLLMRRSSLVQTILAAVPQSWLIGVQVYRGLGAIFLVMLGVGLMPAEFALPAGIGDTLVALSALPIAALIARGGVGRIALATGWNLLGLLDLLFAVATGFLTSPTALQLLALDSPNYLVSSYPLALIPAFGVPLSVILHLASLRKLSQEAEAQPARTLV